MSTGKRVLRCIRCGEPIQYTDKTKPGYVTPDVFLNRNPKDPIYCERCYQEILDTNKIEEDIAVDERIYKILDYAIKSKALIIWAVDLVSFNGLLPTELATKLKKCNVVVIGTRKDFFPKPFNDKPIIKFLENSFKAYGIKPLDIIPMNAKDKKECIDAIERVTKQYKIVNTLDIYLIGPESSGKTTLINTFLKNFENKSDRFISRVEYKDTGVQILETPISNRRTLYEVPGYSNNQSVLAKVERDIHKYIIPKKALKVMSASLRENSAILLGSICALEIKKGIPTTYKLYCGESIEVRKTIIPNIKKAIMNNKINEFCKPVSERLHTFTDYDCIEFVIPKDGKMHEIAAEGLGFATFKGVGQTMWVIVPKGTSVNESISRY